ncbi:MAG TPA: hypothetical protein VI454_13730 [Verrucomicrobiae bacterium]|jgi:hypothetical protein
MKKIALTVLILAGLVTAAWAFQTYRTWKAGETFRNYVTDVENLFIALQQYKDKVGTYPSGNNADVAKALSGKNAKSVIVIVSNRIPVNEKNEFVDQWGTPLTIYFSGNSVLVRSAGPNKKFEDSRTRLSDDIVLSN